MGLRCCYRPALWFSAAAAAPKARIVLYSIVLAVDILKVRLEPACRSRFCSCLSLSPRASGSVATSEIVSEIVIHRSLPRCPLLFVACSLRMPVPLSCTHRRWCSCCWCRTRCGCRCTSSTTWSASASLSSSCWVSRCVSWALDGLLGVECVRVVAGCGDAGPPSCFAVSRSPSLSCGACRRSQARR